jgi:hypothetical protein
MFLLEVFLVSLSFCPYVGLLCPLLSHTKCSLDQHLNSWNQNPFSVAMICRIICGILLLSSTLPQLVWCWRCANHSCLALKRHYSRQDKRGSKLECYPYILLAIDICILAAWGLYLPRILKNWWPVLVYVQGQVHIHTCRGTQCSHWQRGQHTAHQVGKGLIIMYEVCMKMQRHGSEDDPFKRVISHKLLASSQCAAAEDWLPVSCDLVYD